MLKKLLRARLMEFPIEFPDCPGPIEQIKNALVASVHGEAQIPSNVQQFYDWITTEHWQKLIEDLDEGCVIDLSLAKGTDFSDEELSASLEIPAAELTDLDRIDHIKHWIKWQIESDQFFTAHTYALTDPKNRHAVIGCLVGSQGQLGPAVYWQDGFVDRNAFIDYLHRAHIWLFPEIDQLQDFYLLSLWKYSKKRRIRRGSKA
jgi:hypothetical protein